MADLVEQAEAREAEARACFTTHDLDGSNTINAAELATVLTTLGVKKEGVSDDDFKTLVDATLKEHDTNADGVLQFEEFVVMYNAVCLAGAAPAADVPAPAVFKFGSGLRDCVATNPESYKIVAECPNARLVEMRVPPGGEDQPHDHPAHSMFFAKAAKLSITDYGSDGKPAGEPHVVEIPAGASPIFPAGAHQVRVKKKLSSKCMHACDYYYSYSRFNKTTEMLRGERLTKTCPCTFLLRTPPRFM